MKHYVIADEHYNHVNILRFCERPYNSIKGMTRDFIDKNNVVVENDDVVYHLGDWYVTNTSPNGLYFLKKDLQIQDMKNILYQLKGNHILIRGNHDSFSDDEYLDFGFKIVYSEPYILEYNKYRIVMCHDPALVNMYRSVQQNTIFLCGHIHRIFRKSDYPYKIINVGVDVNNYKLNLIDDCIREFYGENNYDSSKTH